MTAICPGGADSEPKPGFSATLFIGPNVIAALLNNIGTPWAVSAALLLNLAAYDLATYCTTDPPADPGLNAGDAIALLTPFHPGKSNATLRFEQFIGRYLWWDLCQCVGGGTPARPAAPAKPTGWPDTEPPALTSTQPCRQVIHDTFVNVDNGFSQLYGVSDFKGLDVTSVQFTFVNQIVTAPGVNVDWQIQWFHQEVDLTLTVLRTDHLFPAPTATLVQLIIPPDTATALQIQMIGSSGSGRTRVQGSWRYFCGGQVPGPLTSCCPPDPALALQISQVLQLVTLMQRQLAPFAYIPSTSHSGLTGDGSIDIQGLIGVKIALTAVPGSLGVSFGTPDEHFDLGFVTFGTADGYPHSVRIEHNPQIILPGRCSAFTKLAYTLHPGVVATITELVREP